ncbi:MAG: hypothetical protein GX638_15890 [Crenarchaeota archaeon]|nr:hypothetical protein [Thermoproteota archaeon]
MLITLPKEHFILNKRTTYRTSKITVTSKTLKGYVVCCYSPKEKWFSVLRENVVYMHFSDNIGLVSQRAEIGAGNIDW